MSLSLWSIIERCAEIEVISSDIDGLDSASVSAKQSAFEQVMATGASVYVYLSQKDKIDRVASIPEIRLARPGLSVFTRQVVKFKREAR
jgi:hypothetical protein